MTTTTRPDSVHSVPTSVSPAPAPLASRVERALAAGALVCTMPYAGIKTAWMFGARAGLTDPSFGHSTAMEIGNALTLFLDVAAAALAAAFVARRGMRAPALLVSFPMWVGYGLLGEILLVMPLTLLGSTVGSRPSSGSSPIAGWVFAFVYAGFTGLGACLLPLFALYARRRWGSVLRERRTRRPVVDRVAAGAAMACTALGVAGLVGASFVSADSGRWMIVDGVLALASAAGLGVLATGRLAVRRWIPVAVVFAGSGSMFAWGLFHSVLMTVPNDLAPGNAPLPAIGYAVSRTVIGVSAGLALVRTLASRQR